MQDNLKSVEDLLACPDCRGNLRIADDGVACLRCATRFPVQDEIPLFARLGTVGEAGADAKADTSEWYQQSYQQEDDAAAYNAMYRDRWTKRISTRREFKLLTRLLESQGRSKVLLDLPCGGGRVSPPLAPHTDLLIEADIALGQVRYGRTRGRVATKQVWMTASGFHIPIRDNGIDGAVCIRLNHHLPVPAERERLVQELLRVSRRFVIMTFFDFHSVKNTLRRLRRPFNGKPPKCTMEVSELGDMARRFGAELVAYPALFPIGSGHRYALMVKKQA